VFAATIFDFNGVLVDDEPVHLAAFREVLAPYGIAISDEDYLRRYLGFDDAGAFRAMLADHGETADDQQIARLVEAKRPAYMRRAEASLVVFEGAAELVRRRAAAGPVGIVSGALRDEIAFALERMGVSSHVRFVVAAEDTTRCKPDPQGYELAIGVLETIVGEHEARRALVVEDSIAGVQAAKGAHLACLAVAHSYAESELWAAGADGVAQSIGLIDEATLRAVAERAFGGDRRA
jgi:beta-phosphoglucomutase